MTSGTITDFLTAHGLWLLAPAALVEGPLATIAAGALAAQGILPLAGVIAVATLADLAGDALLWLAGRSLRHRMPRKLSRRINRTVPLADLRRNAGRVLVFGKLAHSIGAVVLLASGMARVPLLPFLGFNLAATIPKAAALALLGWAFGASLDRSGDWLSPLGLGLCALSLGIALVWLRKQGKPHARLVPDPRP